MKIKIVSDGTPIGTRIVNCETGEPLDHVTNIKLEMDINNYGASCTLTLFGVPIEMDNVDVAEIKYTLNPSQPKVVLPNPLVEEYSFRVLEQKNEE